jgi:CheY-like chemotaxis protein
MDEERKEESLILNTEQYLSVRASIVTRGLQYVIRHRIPSVAWSRPSLFGTLSNPSESFDSADPARKIVYFDCPLANTSESPQNLSEGVAILRRSRTTGEIISVPEDGFGFAASRIFVRPESTFPHILVGLFFPREKSLHECVQELFRESCELLAYDETFGTVIAISLDQPSLAGLPTSYDRKGLRVLEVDDDEAVRKIIRDMLISAGYECTSVPNGVDALALLRSGEKFDLLLHDLLNLPMDGIQLLETARNEFPSLPVITATAIHDIDAALAAFDRGASDYLLLPFSRALLLTIVRQVLAGRNQQRRKALPWEQGLSKLIAPAIENQLVIRTVNRTPKFIRDLIPGDIVLVGAQTLHLVERDGKLGAVASVSTTRE